MHEFSSKVQKIEELLRLMKWLVYCFLTRFKSNKSNSSSFEDKSISRNFYKVKVRYFEICSFWRLDSKRGEERSQTFYLYLFPKLAVLPPSLKLNLNGKD